MRSWLYCPGNNPKMIINASLYGADGLVFDLEDAVSSDRKVEARILLAGAFSEKIVPAEISAVRINGPESVHWKKDLKEVIPSGARIIRIPKVESSGQIQEICREISRIESDSGIENGVVRLQCIFETPLGVEHAFHVGNSSPRIDSYSFGAEDYCTAVGISRGEEQYPLDYPRSRIASAAAAFGYNAYDTVWGFLNDPAGLEVDSIRGKNLGFHGKSVIHPDQVEIVNRLFSPTPEEIESAKRILDKISSGKSGAIALDGRMIDKPVILRAEMILRMAESGRDQNHDE